MPQSGRVGAGVGAAMFQRAASDSLTSSHELPDASEPLPVAEPPLAQDINLNSAVPAQSSKQPDDEEERDAASRLGKDSAPDELNEIGGEQTQKKQEFRVFNKARWASSEDPEGSRKKRTSFFARAHSMRSSVSGMSSAELRSKVARALVSPKFDFFIGIVIVMNAVNIGLEQEFRSAGADKQLETLNIGENIFLTIYVMELLLKFYAMGWKCLEDGWTLFDLFLVVLGVVTQWIIKPVFGDLDEVGPLMILRTARLLRLAKTVRLLIRFRELWMLVRGLLNSANTMFYTLLMLFVIIYIFACLGMELLFEHPKAVGEDFDEDFRAVVDRYFTTLPNSMLTLIQFVCFDNIVMIYRPLAQHDPVLLLYFITLILVIGIVVMNLVTAVIVNSALEQTAQDKDLMKSVEEEKKKQVLKDLRKMFVRLDEDGSGQLSREEIQSVSNHDKEILKNLTSMEDPVEIFDALDVDGSGDIGIDEFCDGLWQVAISNAPIEIKRMEKQIEVIRAQLKGVQQDNRNLTKTLNQVLWELKRLGSEQEELDEPATPMSPTSSKTVDLPAAPARSRGASTPSWAQELLEEVREMRRSSVSTAIATASEKLSKKNSEAEWLQAAEILGSAAAKAAVPAVLKTLDDFGQITGDLRSASQLTAKELASREHRDLGRNLRSTSTAPSSQQQHQRSLQSVSESPSSPRSVSSAVNVDIFESPAEMLMDASSRPPSPRPPEDRYEAPRQRMRATGSKPVFLLQPGRADQDNTRLSPPQIAVL